MPARALVLKPEGPGLDELIAEGEGFVGEDDDMVAVVVDDINVVDASAAYTGLKFNWSGAGAAKVSELGFPQSSLPLV